MKAPGPVRFVCVVSCLLLGGARSAPSALASDADPVDPHAEPLATPVAAGTVEVRVIDGSGAFVTDAEVLLQRGVASAIPVPPSELGRYLLAEVAPGRYVLTVVKTGFAPASQNVTVASERTASLSVSLSPQGLSEAITVEASALVDTTVSKLPTTLHETPRSVTVIGSDAIRERNLRTVNDTFAFSPGITVNSYRTGGYHFYARGYRMLPDDTRVDGFAGLNAGGRYSASLFGVEQVVLLRGPAGLLYGSAGSPGGLVNLVTKKPQEVALTRVDLRGASYSGNGVSLGERPAAGLDLDSTGKLARNGRVLYRVLLTAEDMNYFTDGVRDREPLPPRLADLQARRRGPEHPDPPRAMDAVRPSQRRGHRGLAQHVPHHERRKRRPHQRADLSPLDVNLSEGGGVDEILQTGLTLAARPRPTLRVNAAWRYLTYDTDIDQWAPQVQTPAQIALLRDHALVQRVQSKSNTERRYQNLDANAIWELRPEGAIRSLVQAGVYSRWARTRTTTPNGAVPGPESALDIYTGVPLTPTIDRYPTLSLGDWSDATFWNAYLQNRTSFGHDRLVLSLGLGYGQNTVAGGAGRPSGLIPNAGLVFNADERLALYASYAESYNPADPAAEDAAGRANTFGATTGVNYEVGARWDAPAARSAFTLALFKNQVENGLVQSGPTDLNPNGTRYYVEAGTRRSQGVEVTGDFRPRPQWQLGAALTYLDAIYTGEGPASAQATLALPGSRAEKSPEWAWSLRTRYDFARGPLRGLGATLGVLWQAERLGSNGARTASAPDPLLLPAFTRVDAALFYSLSAHVDLALNVENLLDELIFVSGSVGSSLEVAAPRTLSLRVGYRF